MRALVDRASDRILQVEKVPTIGDPVATNGKYALPTPEGVTVHVEPDSVVLPVSDPNSVVTQAYAGLLAQFPQYEHILFNPLLTPDDVGDLDLTASLVVPGMPAQVFPTRAQTGRRPGGPLPAGQAPTSTAVLPANEGVTPPAPGVLVSNTIDIGPATIDPVTMMPVGADDFAVYWYLYDFQTTEDVRSEVGVFAGVNTPALRNIIEVDQEPSSLEVFISLNDGATFTKVDRLLPVSFCDKGTLLRVAFKNADPTQKIYIAGYAVLF